MTSLWSSDLHLNDNVRDRYRWEFMPWLEKVALNRKVDFIGITGDLTDAKDRHPASLVNKFGDFFARSRNHWVIVTGNHDYIDPGCPFFRFLDNFENVTWVIEPTVLHLPVADKKVPTLLLPATKEWETLWPPNLEDFYPYIFMHGTFAGTLSENGFELPGIPVEFFPPEGFGRLYAGDIHTPGKIADGMEYIGAPYRVHFGDTYKPRIVAISDTRDTEDLHFPGKSRHTVTIRNADDLAKYAEVREDDQVKLRVQLKRSEFPEWRKLRTLLVGEAEALGWEVCGIELLEFSPVRRRLGEDAQGTALHKSPEDHLREYAAAQKYKEPVIKFGLELLNV